MSDWLWFTAISAASGAAGFGGAWAGAAAAGVLAIRRRPRRGPHDVLVVPGSKVYADGRASLSFHRRLRHAAHLHQLGAAPRIVVSGGGAGGRSEGEVGAEILRDLGVPGDAILIEPLARRTAENASYSLALVGPDARVLVVTERWHGPRASLWFRRHFRHVEVVGVDAPWGATVRAALREVPKVLWQGVGERVRPPR